MPVEPPHASNTNPLSVQIRNLARRSAARKRLPWLRRYKFALRLAGCFVAVTLTAALVEVLNRGETGAYFIWVANGLLLAYLLLAPRRRWPAYLCAGFAAYLAAALLVNGHWRPFALTYSVLDLAEVLIAALMLRWRSAKLPNFTDRGYLIRFAATAVVASPVAIGLIFALISAVWLHQSPGHVFLRWAGVDSMGFVVVTPPCVTIFRSRFSSPSKQAKNWLYVFLLVAVTTASFAQATLPLLVLTYPLLILILLGMGMGWATLAACFVAIVGGWFSYVGNGPQGAELSLRLLMLEFVSIVLEKQRVIERQLRKIAAQHNLVMENSRDVIVLSDFNGHRNYVSPAAEFLTGWTPEELLQQSSIEMVHPDDLASANEAFHKLRTSAEGSLLECRIRTADGRYIWVESSLRVAHDPETGASFGILNVVRDIEERKHTEEQLANAYRTVEALAVLDALTGLANRRRFDQSLAKEWRRALRDRKPLSMLLIDADLFKSYNDTYGHPHGDSCLKQIAEAALEVVTRPGDLVARIGGEEFAIILPNTRNQGAMQVANAVCEAMRRRKVPHKVSPYGMMTISIGCATIIPRVGQQAMELIEKADKALYQAKHDGRNRVCNGSAVERSEGKDALPVGAGETS
jgi:diguanylate cyclase (GGDEF)-like protein/PAS domain S-box-containing protein